MPDQQLTTLTTAAIQRARFNVVLWHLALGGLAGLLYATGYVLAQRWYPHLGSSGLNLVTIPSLLLLGCALIGWLRYKETPIHVVSRLDDHAHTHGALTTWNALQEIPATTPLESAFREAQRLDTLKRLEQINLSQHVPVRLPEWSTYGWLAVLALCCAWLLPPREDVELGTDSSVTYSVATQAGGPNAPQGPEAAKPLGSAPTPEHLEISLLTPTDLLKAEVMMQNPQTPVNLKEDFLRELEAKMGALPLENMNAKERELLKELRRQTVAENAPPVDSGTGNDTGTQAKPKENEPVTTAKGLNALPANETERRAVFQERFPDVQTALEKYYKNVK